MCSNSLQFAGAGPGADTDTAGIAWARGRVCRVGATDRGAGAGAGADAGAGTGATGGMPTCDSCSAAGSRKPGRKGRGAAGDVLMRCEVFIAGRTCCAARHWLCRIVAGTCCVGG